MTTVPPTVTTRSCVSTLRPGSVKAKLPVVLVMSGLPTCWKPAV